MHHAAVASRKHEDRCIGGAKGRSVTVVKQYERAQSKQLRSSALARPRIGTNSQSASSAQQHTAKGSARSISRVNAQHAPAKQAHTPVPAPPPLFCGRCCTHQEVAYDEESSVPGHTWALQQSAFAASSWTHAAGSQVAAAAGCSESAMMKMNRELLRLVLCEQISETGRRNDGR